MTIVPGNDLPNSPENLLELWEEAKSSSSTTSSADGQDLEAAVESVKESIKQVLSTDEIESDANNPFPIGSDESGIYEDMRVPNPEKDDPIQKAQESTSSINGYSQELAEDLKGWQEDLGDVGRKEIETVLQTYGKVGKAAIKPFKKELENSIKTTSSAAVALRNDYDEGNTHVKNNNIRQVNANQHRVGCDSFYSVKSPVIITGSKQYVQESEQSYIINDITHTTTKHYWLRSEWSENYMSLLRTSYIIDHSTTYAANDSNFAGMRRFYSDEYVHEVGQITFQNLHPSRSRPSNYGKCTIKSIKDQDYYSKLGNINETALQNININAQTGIVAINSWANVVSSVLSTIQDVISSPGTMSDPPKHEKQDFKAPSGPALSRNNDTPESYNFKQAVSSGVYKTSLGPQGGNAVRKAEKYGGNDDDES